MKISIIGTNGMLSTCLSKEFFRLGHTVDTYGLDKPEYSCSGFYKTDLLENELDYGRIVLSDVIIYASGAGVQAALATDPTLMYRLNVFVPVMITRQLKNYGYHGLFISFGTYMEIGLNDDPEAIFTEEDVICSRLRVTNDYALSKRLFGRYINDFTADFTFWHFILPNMFSPDDIKPGTRLIPYVLSYLLRYRSDPGCPLPSFSSGSQLRQYIRMEDIVVVINKALEKQMQSGVYNIGGGEYLSIRQLIERLFNAYGVPFRSGMFGKEQRRDGDIKCLHISGNKLFEKIGFLPSVKIDEIFPGNNS